MSSCTRSSQCVIALREWESEGIREGTYVDPNFAWVLIDIDNIELSVQSASRNEGEQNLGVTHL